MTSKIFFDDIVSVGLHFVYLDLFTVFIFPEGSKTTDVPGCWSTQDSS